MRNSGGISARSSEKNASPALDIRRLIGENYRFLRKRLYRPVLKACCIRAIRFYQTYLSRHTCLYEPSCSEYTKRCINNWGVPVGILLGLWRILRCNPFSKGGPDPAPELFWKVRWLY